MRIRRDRKPFERMVATDASLDFAALVAQLSGLPFDREQVRNDAANIGLTIFNDLCRMAELDRDRFRFETGSYFQTRIFSLNDKEGGNIVALDRGFDLWLSSMCLLSAVATFEVLTDKDFAQLCDQTERMLALFVENSGYDRRCEEMKAYLVRYAHLLNVSEALSRAMLVFALCHEIAHHELGHLTKEASPDMEFEADALGLRLFLKVFDAGDAARESTFYIDPKVVGAPLILSHLIELLETWCVNEDGMSSADTIRHPAAAQRMARLNPLLRPRLNETAGEALKGFAAGIGDLRKAIC